MERSALLLFDDASSSNTSRLPFTYSLVSKFLVTRQYQTDTSLEYSNDIPGENIALYGPIGDDWKLVQALEVTVEEDEDGSLILSDDVFVAYGVGDTYYEAYNDFIAALISSYEISKDYADSNSASKEHFEHLQSYLRPIP